MATTTTKLALTKPDGTDLVDIAVLNANADKIDAASGATICTSSTRPASPWNGQVIFETDTLNALVYRTSTTSWNILGGSTVASEPPAGAGNGNFWWDSDNGKLYIYYNDGNSSQWVSVMPSQTTVDVAQNYIINGAFDIWQRGTSFTNGAFAFDADRWLNGYDGTIGAHTQTQVVLSPGEIAGFNGKYARRWNITSAGSGSTYRNLIQRIEEISILAGKTVTVSFWAKADTNTRTITPAFYQSFGTGGSTAVSTSGSAITLSTSWVRYSQTLTVPSISGKTVGANSFTELQLQMSLNTVMTVDVTGVQVENGSVATSFKRAAGTLQGELAACQRYYWRAATGNSQVICNAFYYSANEWDGVLHPPVTMRTKPSLDFSSGTDYYTMIRSGGNDTFNGFILDGSCTENVLSIYQNVNISGTTGQGGFIRTYNSAAYLGFSAEL